MHTMHTCASITLFLTLTNSRTSHGRAKARFHDKQHKKWLPLCSRTLLQLTRSFPSLHSLSLYNFMLVHSVHVLGMCMVVCFVWVENLYFLFIWRIALSKTKREIRIDKCLELKALSIGAHKSIITVQWIDSPPISTWPFLQANCRQSCGVKLSPLF